MTLDYEGAVYYCSSKEMYILGVCQKYNKIGCRGSVKFQKLCFGSKKPNTSELLEFRPHANL